MVPWDSTPKTDVPYTCACRTDSAILYPSERSRVEELNLSWRRRITVVITRMMIETTRSSIKVNPLEERRKYLEKIDMQKVGERGAEDKEGGEGHLAPHCIPSREGERRGAPTRSPHPRPAGYPRDRHEREREISPREQPGKREPVFNPHKYERAERQKPHRAPRDYFVAQVVDENKKQYHPHRKRRKKV